MVVKCLGRLHGERYSVLYGNPKIKSERGDSNGLESDMCQWCGRLHGE
jgi:hypothetical protein